MVASLTSGVLQLMLDPTLAVGLLVVAVVTLYYLKTRPTPMKSPIALDSQTVALFGGERVSHHTKDGKLVDKCFEDAGTLHEAFQRGKRISNDGPCLGTRALNKPYKWITYSQVEERSVSFGGGLCSIGVPPGQGSFIGVYGPNCTEWVVSEQSCNSYSRVVVPLYDTLGREAVIHIINQADISCVVCNGPKVPNLLTLKESCPSLKTVIVFEDSINDQDTQTANEKDIKIYTMKQIEEMGRKNPVDIKPASPSDLATICYTSGTTGLPKGVMLTHGNIVSAASAVLVHMSCTDCFENNPLHISYLPLAHIMERVAQAVLFMVGGRVGFFRGDVQTLINDIQELKPDIFISVPRLLNKMYDKVMVGVNSSPVKKFLFNMAYNAKVKELRLGIVRNNSIWDQLVFKKVQKSLGGNVKLILSGSAPISAKTMEFLRVVFGCYVLEGYGQTESSATLTFGIPMDTSVGHVGTVLPATKIKMRDVPDMNYYSSNGEGEICFTGPCVTRGYYKNPEKTAELFDEDGWARSGDVGRWLPNGTLKIIDRVKNIFKLSQGEYIAPEKVENVCTRSKYISQMGLFGDSLKSCCVAIVVPDEEVMMAWAASNGRKGTTLQELCSDKEVQEMIFKDIVNVARENGLNSLEIPKSVKLCAVPFSVENGLLTPTFKLVRSQLKTKFMNDFKEMYAKLK